MVLKNFAIDLRMPRMTAGAAVTLRHADGADDDTLGGYLFVSTAQRALMGRAQRLGFIRERPKPRGGIVVGRHKGRSVYGSPRAPSRRAVSACPCAIRDTGYVLEDLGSSVTGAGRKSLRAAAHDFRLMAC